MQIYVESLIILPLLVLCFQLYSYSVNGGGRERQERCQNLGIAFMTVGITALVLKSAPFAFLGLILIMFGFRLLAKGLDRLDKNIFIDQYEDDK
jgi:integral membrane sensor domain MASE1